MARSLGSAQLREFASIQKSCEALRTTSELQKTFDGAIRSFGFSWFALVDDGDIGTHLPNCLMMTNYPTAWVDEVISCRLYRHDPVHAASIRSPAGLCWERIGEFIAPTRTQLSIMERGRSHGLRSGYTVPFRIAGERGAFFTIARPEDRPFTFIETATAQILGGILFEKARELVRSTSTIHQRVRLSPRQIDCLQLIAAGKTEWEMGIILDLSPSTIHDYVESARRRYGVRTRSQLVLAAARDGYISLNHLP